MSLVENEEGPSWKLLLERPTPRPNQILHPEDLKVGMVVGAHYRGGFISDLFVLSLPEERNGTLGIEVVEANPGKFACGPQFRYLSDSGVVPYRNSEGLELWNPTNWLELISEDGA